MDLLFYLHTIEEVIYFIAITPLTKVPLRKILRENPGIVYGGTYFCEGCNCYKVDNLLYRMEIKQQVHTA